MPRVPISPYPCQHLPSVFWVVAVLTAGRWYLLDLMTSDVEPLVMCLLAIWVSLENCPLVLCPFFNWVDFFVVDFEELSVYFICESFIRHLNYKYSLPFFGLPFNIVESVLWCTSYFWWSLTCITCAFGVIFRKSLPSPASWSFSVGAPFMSWWHSGSDRHRFSWSVTKQEGSQWRRSLCSGRT